MVRLKRLAASAVLSAVIANPAFAQAVIQESGAYAKNYATADLAIGAPLSSRMAINETSKSTVWPAPVGHHHAAGRRYSLICIYPEYPVEPRPGRHPR